MNSEKIKNIFKKASKIAWKVSKACFAVTWKLAKVAVILTLGLLTLGLFIARIIDRNARPFDQV